VGRDQRRAARFRHPGTHSSAIDSLTPRGSPSRA
jgi:hypothetical protein